ncbi:CocE/NonD family hydrolase [Lentzea sp. NPDC059081]|uniref:CocE/NonD family hydrolase n=1 Tax=Lentzea sp. NPDC059081 TaxID=3346719 RepID=UPI0036ABE0A8
MPYGEPFELLYRLPIPPEEGKYPGLSPSRRVEHGLLVERDVPVRMRDGVVLRVDVFRPEGQSDLPVLLTYSPYGKHARKGFHMLYPQGDEDRGFVDPGTEDVTVSHYTVWEGPDPLYWCGRGFAVVNADARGSWGSEGTLTFHSPQEADDGFDLVEWAAGQPWSNGRVGMTGVSYLAWSQWNVAATRPPHLYAINPWEGYSDPYRDISMHGGMRETRFRSWWIESTAYSRNRVEDVVEMCKQHPHFDAYWAARTPDLSKIEVPLYAVVDWGDHGIHTRGTIEGFKQASSTEKWLEVHGRMKWPYYYRPESLARQLEFFTTFLKKPAGATLDWPPVTIEVRESHFVGEVRDEKAWPLEATTWTPLYLDASSKGLRREAPPAASVAYDSQDDGDHAEFTITFGEDTELTGTMSLQLWVESASDDADLFVAIEKLDRDGRRVTFPLQSMFHDGPVALGWLRASHRELDPGRSTPGQPWHTHARSLPLEVGVPTLVDIEIWPSSTLFRAGEGLVLRVKGTEFHTYPGVPAVIHHQEPLNVGPHTIHTGGDHPSRLLVPVIRDAAAPTQPSR